MSQCRATTLLSQLSSLASLPEEWQRVLAITSPDPELLRALRSVSGTEYDNSLSINSATPADILELLDLTNSLIRRDLASHPNTPQGRYRD